MPIIQSAQELGKSFFIHLLKAALGEDNVVIIDNSTVFESYTDWAANKLCNVLEELKVQGHNKYEVLNKLKTYLTDDRIIIRRMYKAPTYVYNTTNYITFTNYIDDLPIEYTDRHLYPINSPVKSVDHLEQIINKKPPLYFKKLYSYLKYINTFVE